MKQIWTCKIGECDSIKLPKGADTPMRIIVESAYTALTGDQPIFLFSGWGGKLNEYERAVIEKRDPGHPYLDAFRHAMRDRQYGFEETRNAKAWFMAGWQACGRGM